MRFYSTGDNMFASKIRLKVREGTRSDEKRLCDTCQHGTVLKGAAESEEVIHCNAIDGFVPIRVVQCSDYIDKSVPTLGAMREIAWVLRTDKSGKKIGFVGPKNRDDRYFGSYDDDD